MKLRSVRYIFGVTVLSAHVLTAVSFLVFGQMRLGSIQDIVDQITPIMPLAAVYLTAFIGYVTSFPNGASDEKNAAGQDVEISSASFFVQFAVVLLFSVALLSVAPMVFLPTDGSYDGAGVMAAWIDTAFATYLGLIFKRLFPFN